MACLVFFTGRGEWQNRPVRRRRLILLVAAFVLVASGTVWFSASKREPTYGGKSLSQWIEMYNGWVAIEMASGDVSDLKTNTASVAVRHIGTNALPHLVRWIDWRPGRGKQKVLSVLEKAPRWLRDGLVEKWLKGDPRRAEGAEFALKVLGPEAAAAIPQFERMMTNASSSDGETISGAHALACIGMSALPALLSALTNQTKTYCRVSAAYAMQYVDDFGRDSGQVARALAQSLKDPDPRVGVEAARSLGKLKMEPQVTVSALVKHLQLHDPMLTFLSARVLAEYGQAARPAVPELLRSLNHQHADVRQAAADALLKIAPETLENSGTGPAGENRN